MADKNSVSDWSETAIDNDNIGGISLQENVMRPPAVNNAFREMMKQVRSFFPLGVLFGGTGGSTAVEARTALKVLSYDTQSLTDADRSQVATNLGGGWEVVPNGKKSVSAVSSTAWTGLGAYSILRVTLSLVPSTTQDINIQVSANDGVSYYTLASDYLTAVMFSVNGLGPNAGAASTIGVGIASSATTASLVAGTCLLCGWKQAIKTSASSDFVFSQSTGLGVQKGNSQHTTAGALNAFRIICTAGTFTGDILVEGIK